MSKMPPARVYIEKWLKIQTKDGTVEPLKLNEPQRRLMDEVERQEAAGKPVRIIILKARQMGFSTLTEAMIFYRTATAFATASLIVAHTDEATNNLFRMSRRYYDELPPILRPMLRASNAQELDFDKPLKSKIKAPGLGSRIRCATAGGKGVGRSYTLRCLHLSEYAFWPGDKAETFTGLVQAVPDKPGTMIVIESTANGFDDFKAKWDNAVEAQRRGEDGFVPVFFPWYEMQEYRRDVPPGFALTQEERVIRETFGLDEEQMAWRRWCIANQCGGDINLFHQEYPATPDEAFISTGRCVFDQAALVLRREQVRKDAWERGVFRVQKGTDGRILSYEWTADQAGPIRIRKQPEKDVPYVIGGDTAGTGSDYFAGQVLDNRTGEQVAVLHHQFGERMYAEQMYCLGMYYNSALIGVETNYSTYPEMVLEELNYPKLYVRERYDTYTGEMAKAFGFDTNSKTRQVLVDGLKDAAQEALDTITDYDTLGEMLTFVYDEKWKGQAEQGEHDDLVMALGIAHAIRGQQSTTGKKERKMGTTVWTADMWEDYRKAGKEEREFLVSIWGEPKQ